MEGDGGEEFPKGFLLVVAALGFHWCGVGMGGSCGRVWGAQGSLTHLGSSSWDPAPWNLSLSSLPLPAKLLLVSPGAEVHSFMKASLRELLFVTSCPGPSPMSTDTEDHVFPLPSAVSRGHSATWERSALLKL